MHYGIVDYVTTKHLYMFDFSKNENPDYILLASWWKMSIDPNRFSVYCVLNYPELKLPRTVLIPKALIKKTNASTIPTKKPKQRNFTIKSSAKD